LKQADNFLSRYNNIHAGLYQYFVPQMTLCCILLNIHPDLEIALPEGAVVSKE